MLFSSEIFDPVCVIASVSGIGCMTKFVFQVMCRVCKLMHRRDDLMTIQFHLMDKKE